MVLKVRDGRRRLEKVRERRLEKEGFEGKRRLEKVGEGWRKNVRERRFRTPSRR